MDWTIVRSASLTGDTCQFRLPVPAEQLVVLRHEFRRLHAIPEGEHVQAWLAYRWLARKRQWRPATATMKIQLAVICTRPVVRFMPLVEP